MLPAKRNLIIYKGAAFRDKVTWLAGVPQVPVDLTGCSARAQFRTTADHAEVLLELSTEDGGIALGGALGTVEMEIDQAGVAALTWQKAVYDVLITFPDGYVDPFIAGEANVVKGVTHD